MASFNVLPASRDRIANNSPKFSSYKSAILFNTKARSACGAFHGFAAAMARSISITLARCAVPRISVSSAGFMMVSTPPDGLPLANWAVTFHVVVWNALRAASIRVISVTELMSKPSEFLRSG